MKKQILLITTFISLGIYAQTGNVGINTSTPGSTLTLNGSFAGTYKTGTATSLDATDYYYAWNGTSAGTMTLPAVATASPAITGRVYNIKNTGTATLTIAGSGSELLDNQSGAGVANISLSAGQYAQLIAKNTTSGTTWEVALVGSGSYVEPWNVAGTTTPATLNTQNIYQMGNVGIGTNNPVVNLDVVGTATSASPGILVRTPTNTNGAVYLGNFSHGVQRGLTGSTGGGGNDVALFTSAGDLYLVANPVAGGNTNLPLNQFVLKNTGRVGIGTSTPASPLHVVSSGNGINSAIILDSYSQGVGPGGGGHQIVFRKAADGSSTVTPSSGGNITSGNVLGAITFQGWNGTAFGNAAVIRPIAEGDFTSTSMPTGILFSTGSTTSGAAQNTMWIGANGGVAIGRPVTAAPNSTLSINGSLSANIRNLGSGTVADNDYTVIVTGNISLPAPDATASTGNTGRIYYLVNGSGTNKIITGTFKDAGVGTSFASFTLNNTPEGKAITVQSDGTAWWIISRN